MKFSRYGSPHPSSFYGMFHPEILTGSLPPVGASNGRGEKTSHFLALNVNISNIEHGNDGHVGGTGP